MKKDDFVLYNVGTFFIPTYKNITKHNIKEPTD